MLSPPFLGILETMKRMSDGCRMKKSFIISPTWYNNHRESSCGAKKRWGSSFLLCIFVIIVMTIVSGGHALWRHKDGMAVIMSEGSGITPAAILDPTSLGQSPE